MLKQKVSTQKKYGHALVAVLRLVSPQVPRLTPPPQNRTKPRVSNRIACYMCSARAPPRLSDLQAPWYPRAPATSIASSASFCVPRVYQIWAPHLPRAPRHVYEICRLHSIHACPATSIRSAGSIVSARTPPRLSDLQAPYYPRTSIRSAGSTRALSDLQAP